MFSFFGCTSIKEDYYENGKLKSKWEHLPDKRKHGESTQWYANGNLKERGIYTNGQKDEKWTYWYENGNKMKEGNYSPGEFGAYGNFKSGQWVFWYENGNIMKQGHYTPTPLQETFYFNNGSNIGTGYYKKKPWNSTIPSFGSNNETKQKYEGTFVDFDKREIYIYENFVLISTKTF